MTVGPSEATVMKAFKRMPEGVNSDPFYPTSDSFPLSPNLTISSADSYNAC